MARPSQIRPQLDALLRSHHEPHAWTLEELRQALARLGIHSNFSSIFRSARQAVDQGQWQPVMLGDGKTRFEWSGHHHDHLFCQSCGTLEAVPCKLAQSLHHRMEQQTGYRIHSHSMVWEGTCPRCVRKRSCRKPALPTHKTDLC